MFCLVGVLAPAVAFAQTEDEGDEPLPEALAAEAQRALDQFLRGQKILFMEGELELEGSALYSTDSEDNVRVGDVVIPENTTRELSTSLLGRYAVTDDFEVNLSVPLVYAESNRDFTLLGTPAPQESDEFGVGDIRAGVRYQLLREEGFQPDLAVAFDVKSDTGDELTGTENWGLGARTTLVKTLDPVVFFGGLGYTAMLEQDGVDRGDELVVQFGTGFSVNDRVSYNMQIVGRSIGNIELNGQSLAGTSQEVIGLQFGVTTLLTKNLYLEPFVNVGATDDAPDVVVGINVPYRFDRRFLVGSDARTTNWYTDSLSSLARTQRAFPDTGGKSTSTGADQAAGTPRYSESPDQGWAVQVGAYTGADNAAHMRTRLREQGFPPSTTETILENGSAAVRVWVGPFASRSGAQRVQRQLEDAIGANGLVTCRHCEES